MDKIKSLTIFGILVFILFILYAYFFKVYDYINDSIIFIILLFLIYFLRKKLNLTPSVYLIMLLSFFLHSFGVFGFYNESPVKFQWDHITHIAGNFAATLFLYKACKKFFSKSKWSNLVIIFLILLASLGLGVFVEYIEFIGYFTVGEGMGVLGHGKGDIVTELGNSEWLNTMLDLIYNLVGTLLALSVVFLLRKVYKPV